MSEPQSTLPVAPQPPPPPRRRRRWILLLGLCLVFLIAAAPVSLYFWASSEAVEGFVRKRIVAELERITGGRVEIASFHWHLLDLEADAAGLVIHGLEAPGEAPYAQAERLRVRFSLLGFWSPRIQLRDLEISHPAFHLIVYPDGSTNQPQPRKPRKQGKSGLDTFFDLQAGHVAVRQGVLDYEDRAAAFDFQNRFALLDFDANDVSLRMSYVAATSGVPESFRLEAGAADLNLARGRAHPVHGYLQATLDLTRTAAYLRSLRITSTAHAAKDQTLEISGTLRDFAHPHWQARAVGDLDMKLLDPVFGYPFAPQGIAHLDLDCAGEAGEFRADGSIHVEDGSYIGTGVVATGIRLDAHIHADPKQLLITSIVARLRQGGQLEGEVALEPWLPPLSGAAVLQPAGQASVRATGPPPRPRASATPHGPDLITIPVNGKVTAQFKDVALDTLLDMVGQAPFQRLGLDARINGLATAVWSKGDQQTITVAATLNLSPPTQGVAGEVPANGSVDATYTQRDGAVDLRKLELLTPASQLQAHGHLGAYPLTSPSALAVDFHSHNLNEFDAVLRDLGLNRYGKTGAAALPVTLAGQLDFLHGTWTGSLVDPRLAGNLRATQLAIELLPIQPVLKGKPLKPQVVQPRFIRWDSVEAAGSYAAERIDVSRGLLRRGKAEIALDGSLDAAPGRAPEFDANSVLHLPAKSASTTCFRSPARTCSSPARSMRSFRSTDPSTPLAVPDGPNWTAPPSTASRSRASVPRGP